MKNKIEGISVGKGMRIVHNSGNVCTLYIDNVFEGWELYLLMTSDRHHDSVDCDREMEKYHLGLAKKRKAFIIDVGDLFDAMQGKFDPRRSYSNLRPEYAADNYLDEIVKEAAEFYSPYVNQFLVMGRGNHESAILKNNGVDLTGNLVHRLNADHGGTIQAGGYGGWVRVLCTSGTSLRQSVTIKYFHGAGGGSSPVTRGVIQTNRQAVYLPDADIVVNGHNHEAWYMPISRERLNDMGRIEQDIQHHIRTATYKLDYGDGSKGWHVETGKPPKPIGAVWVRLYYAANRKNRGKRISIEPILGIE